jgi:hypothetical protein
MANKIANEKNWIENGQFSGGVNLTTTGSFGFVAGGLYVGTFGNLTATTVDGSQITLVNIAGFVPGLFVSVDSGSTASNIVAFR